MKKYLRCGKVWIVSGICGFLCLLLFTIPFGERSVIPYLSGVLLFILLAFLLSAIAFAADRAFDPIIGKYVHGNLLISEPVRIESVRGDRKKKRGRLVLTDKCVLVLLENEGYRFPIEEDHSFIYIHRDKKILLAKNGADLEIAAGDFLNNLPMIADAIEKAGFRISQREHAPY